MENIIQNNEQLSEQASITQDTFTEDIMSVFDTQGEVEASHQDDISEQQQEIEIDDKFKHLDPYEAKLRTLQSRHDRIYNEYQKLVKEQEENIKYLNILNDLFEDDIVFEAFVKERRPELIKERDVTNIIQEKLRQEFGDVRYSRAEADENPGGKAWLYFKRLDELYSELKGNSPKVNTLKEALEYKRQQRQKQEAEKTALLQKEIEEVKKTMNWNDENVKRFTEWANKLKLIDFAKMYNYAIRTFKVPSIANQNIGQPVTQSLRSKFINNL